MNKSAGSQEVTNGKHESDFDVAVPYGGAWMATVSGSLGK
jgi:hypothetical protein